MPAALPVIAAAAAASAAPAGIAFTIGSLAVTTATVYSAAASIATSLLVGALTKPKAPDISSALNNPGGGRTQQVRQPISALQITFGRIKASGPIIGISSSDDDAGRANGYLFLIHGLSGHRCRAIEDIYLDDDLSTAAKFAGLVRVNKHLGASDQVADADLVAEIPDVWTTDHRLRGRAYIATRLKWDPAAFANGPPNISAILWGCDEIYDPRTGATGWENNAALCIAKWFTADFGMNLPWSALDEDTVIAAANVCDERIRVKSGSATFSVTAGSPSTGQLTPSSGVRKLDVGDGVRLTTTGTLPGGFATGTTYYVIPSDDETIKLASTVANAKAGIAILPSSEGTSTHTLIYWDEARYKLNGQFTLDTEKGEVLKQLLTAMAGVAVYIGGKWYLHAGAAATPTITLTEDDARGDIQWIPKRSMRDRFNIVRAVYVNPDANWQPVDAPPRTNPIYLAEDAGEELSEDIRHTFTISTRTEQRLQKIALELNRRQGTLQFPAKLKAMRLQAWDGVYVTLDRYGWDRKQFRVINWTLSEDGGVDLTLQEDDADVYAWDADEEIDTAIQQGVILPDPSTIDAPEEVTVTTPTDPTFTNIMAQWAETPSIWLDGYDVEYRGAGGTDWTGYGRVAGDVSREVSLERATAQDVRVRSVTKNAAPSDFTENLAPEQPTGFSATAGDTQITLAATFTADVTNVQIFRALANDATQSTLRTTKTPAQFPYDDTGLTNGTTYYYWLRAINAGGNFSTLAGAASATPAASGGGD